MKLKSHITIFIIILCSLSLFQLQPLEDEPIAPSQFSNDEIDTPKAAASWKYGGVPICTEVNSQQSPDICSDGSNGAIMAWQDYRSATPRIYVQKINSDGDTQWTSSGVLVVESSGVGNPSICSDGAGGAIIAWRTASTIMVRRITSAGTFSYTAKTVASGIDQTNDPIIKSDYASGGIITWSEIRSTVWRLRVQRVNSVGTMLWTANGVEVTTNDFIYGYSLVTNSSADSFVGWYDGETGNYNTHAQKLDSSGSVQWTAGGIGVGTQSYGEVGIEICLDSNNGIFATYYGGSTAQNVYLKRINTAGSISWSVTVASSSNDENQPKIVADGSGGAVLAWYEIISSVEDHIMAQRVDSSGTKLWGTSGVILCDAYGKVEAPHLTRASSGDYYVVWPDKRDDDNRDIYGQMVSSAGELSWTSEGVPIAIEDEIQRNSFLVASGTGAIIVWFDGRNGDNDIYCSYIDEGPQISTTSGSIITNKYGVEIIQGIITSSTALQGKYRVRANDTDGNLYLWLNWTSWTNNTAIYASINRTQPGNFKFLIEYYESDLFIFGSTTEVLVYISDLTPHSASISNITTNVFDGATINWSINDDYGGGKYRIRIRDINTTYTWQDWTVSSYNVTLKSNINRTWPGTYYYTLEYYDKASNYGISNTVIVNVTDLEPYSNNLANFNCTVKIPVAIYWKLVDDFGGYRYRIWIINQTDITKISPAELWLDWQPWSNNSFFIIPVNTSEIGIFVYRIEYQTITLQNKTEEVLIHVKEQSSGQNQGSDTTEPSVITEFLNNYLTEDQQSLLVFLLIGFALLIGIVNLLSISKVKKLTKNLRPDSATKSDVSKKVEKKPNKKVEKKPNKKVEKKPNKKVEKKPNKKVEKKPNKKVEKKPNKKVEKKPDKRVSSSKSNKNSSKNSSKNSGYQSKYNAKK
jgi:hypothetical protein